MTTCGYTCPKCGGSGYDDQNMPCDWCAPIETTHDDSFKTDSDEEE